MSNMLPLKIYKIFIDSIKKKEKKWNKQEVEERKRKNNFVAKTNWYDKIKTLFKSMKWKC